MKNLARRLSLCQHGRPESSERPGHATPSRFRFSTTHARPHRFLQPCECLRQTHYMQGSQLIFPILEQSVPERSALVLIMMWECNK